MNNRRQGCALVWFRRDLRLHDNAALTAATESGKRIVPVYIHSEGNEALEPGAAARWWLHHALVALRADLESIGLGLACRRNDDAAAEIESLCLEYGADEVHWNRLYDPGLVERDRDLRAALHARGVTAQGHGGALLHEPTRTTTRAGDPFRVFTPFWKNLQQSLHVAEPLPQPGRATGMRAAGCSLDALELLPQVHWTEGLARCWQPGESAAHRQLATFLEEGLANYPTRRDMPSRENVSRLSPSLHFGHLSPRQVWQAVQAADASEQAKEAFLRELGWREFAHHVLFHFPQTASEPLHAKYRAFPWRENPDALLRAWQAGRTGYPLVDAGMRQLWQTGWMHNRIRMVVASFLVKNLRIRWQDGAAWFMDTLVDADLASNTFNWQWSAGCGADAAPYFRIFNPITQGEKFEAADYIREFIPELRALPETWLHRPWETPEDVRRVTGFVPGRDYPLPIVDYRTSREEALAALKSLR